MSTGPENQSDEIEKRRVCSVCIGELYLRAEIARTGTETQCHYCEEDRKTLSLAELADRVELAFEQHYDRTSDQPDGFESAMMSDRESDYSWERKGEEAMYAIANALNVDEPIAEDIREILGDRHFDFEDAKMGEESEFAKDAHYAEKSPDDFEFQTEWNLFERDLTTEARFFSSSAHATLGRVFDRLDRHRTKAGNPVVVSAGPDDRISSFFRARMFQAEDHLREAIMRPDIEIGPPPPKYAVAGRMNAAGIAVFYGARDVKTALSEVRPPVGSHVVTAQFGLIRPVRLLDVDALHEVFVEGSIFDPSYLQQLQHAKFLGSLSARMSRVVLPADERDGYLVTQVIADYLANIVKLDGILYRSVQVNESSANVVLFHHAVGVEPIAPPNTEFDAVLYMNGEDGPEPMFTVWEDVPTEPPPAPPQSPLDLLLAAAPIDYLATQRLPTLKIVPNSIIVHYITGASYATAEQSVSRHRRAKIARDASSGL